MKLVITIDTEEDNWDDYSPSSTKISHMERLRRAQDLFDELGYRPTYLITYPMATTDEAIRFFTDTASSGRCEVGAHCHPWNTPPFEEETTPVNSMLSNLPPGLQFRKIRNLHEAIEKNLGINATSFRCGRWGYSNKVAETLLRLGYKVDTSITAFTDWSAYHGPDFSSMPPDPFRFSPSDIFTEDREGPMLEVPATVGFLQSNFSRSNSILKTIKNTPLRRLRLEGIMYRAGMLNRVSLSPELADSSSMIALTETMMRGGYLIANMFFHSPSLKEGLSPFVASRADEANFLKSIREYLSFSVESGIEPITLSETISI